MNRDPFLELFHPLNYSNSNEYMIASIEFSFVETGKHG